MSVQDSLEILQQRIKNFQEIVKGQILNLSKFKINVIKPNNEKQAMVLTMAIYFLRNSINDLIKPKLKLKDFNKLHLIIKNLFQKFIDTNELIKFDKGEDLFKTLNENNSISCFKILFSDLFRQKVNMDVFENACSELKESLSNFNNFKDKFREVHSKILYLESLSEKFNKYQEILNIGNLKKINEENLEDFRIFRSFFPLQTNSEYLIDINKEEILKIE